MTRLIAVALLTVTGACAAIPYGGEVPFEAAGPETCIADGIQLTGTARNPVRCAPQAVPVEN